MIAALAPVRGILGVDDMRGIGAIGRYVSAGVEQIAAAVALEDAAEAPAVAVIVGELRVLVRVVAVIDVAQEFDVGTQAARAGALRVRSRDRTRTSLNSSH